MMRSPRPTLLALALALLALAAPTAAAAAPERTSLPDVEDEVMCLVCGTALNVAQAPAADKQRALIRRLIEQGMTKQQIKDRLVDEYGSNVLATPEGEGFALAAWLVPAALVLAGGGLVAFLLQRWRRGGDGGAGAGATDATPELAPDDARRLDDELATFDR